MCCKRRCKQRNQSKNGICKQGKQTRKSYHEKEINNQITKDLKSLVPKLNDYKELDLNIISRQN